MKWYEIENENVKKYSYWNCDSENYDDLVLNLSDIEVFYENAKEDYDTIEDFIIDGIRFGNFIPVDNVETQDNFLEEIADKKTEIIDELRFFLNDGNFYDDSVLIDEVNDFLKAFNEIEVSETKLLNAIY